MHLANPFKSREFNVLLAEWNKRLEAEGFVDIETTDLPVRTLNAWHNHRWRRKSLSRERFQDIEEYFQLATELIELFPFESETHRHIWILHCEGKTVRQIAMEINQWKIKKSTVSNVIRMIARLSGLRNG